MQQTFSVDPLPSGVSLGTDPVCFGDVTVDPAQAAVGSVANADFVLYITAVPVSSSSTVAWATSCAYGDTGRPVIGHANFAPLHLTGQDVGNIVKTGIHEVFHSLGFDYDFATTKFLRLTPTP